MKSSLQMNSDSPSPFFGLQLAVDAETPSVQIPSTMKEATDQSASFADAPHYNGTKAISQTASQPAVFAKTQSSRSADFRFTAAEKRINGNLKLALPKSKPKSGSPEAEQLADLLHRLKRS